MPWVDVECPNEACPGREESHAIDCVCKGSGRAPREDGRGYEDCQADGDVVPERWRAFWFNSTLSRPGEWDSSIHCPKCGTEGEEADG